MPRSVNFRRKAIFATLVGFLLSALHTVDAEAYDAVIDHLRKDGDEYYDCSNDGDNCSNYGDISTHINGGWAKYSFDVSEWRDWIDNIKVIVKYNDADYGGDAWPEVQVWDKGDDRYEEWGKLKSESTKDETFTKINDRDYLSSQGGGRYTVTVKVWASPEGADDSSVNINWIKLHLGLNYDFNTAQIRDAPRVVDFGTIDVGVDNTRSSNVYIENVGAGDETLEWTLDGAWVEKRSNLDLDPGDAHYPRIRIQGDRLNPGNIAELEGTLIPISDTGLSPTKDGLKGDFYHLPDQRPDSLDQALRLLDERGFLVDSDIFPEIEFHEENRGTTDFLDEDDRFWSQDETARVRRRFVAIFTGFIEITAAGSHDFSITSPNAYRLKIDDDQVIRDRIEGGSVHTRDGKIELEEGFHQIELQFWHYNGEKGLTLRWQPPGQAPGQDQMSIVPSRVLHNSLNVLVRARPRKPTVEFTNDRGDNNEVNVAVGERATFTVEARTTNTGADNSWEYRWQKKDRGDSPGTLFEKGDAPKWGYDFDQAKGYTVYCQAADGKGAASDWEEVPVRAWNRPTVKDAPPSDADVSWYDNKYAGVAGEPVSLMADGQTETSGSGESIEKYLWNLDGNQDTVEREQAAGDTVQYIWSEPNDNGEVFCKAVTNYGVESHEKRFSLRIYRKLEVDPGGPYTGKPTKPVELAGSVNESSYSGASFDYQWSVDAVEVETDGDGRAEYTWQDSGRYEAEFKAVVTTAEGLKLEDSATDSIIVEAGVPESRPGGPYRGGIAGGNYSPVQFSGNHPDEVQSDDVGKMVDWRWRFTEAEGDTARGVSNPTHAFEQAGEYEIGLKVQSEYGKWSEETTARVRVIDGTLSGQVRAADLRTSVPEVRLILRSSHVDRDVLARISSADSSLNTTGDGGIRTATDSTGRYAFEHLPMGSYRITASKGSGDTAHEFEVRTRTVELTLDGPNQQAVDYVDLSVYPVGGRVVYSIQKGIEDVLVQGVEVTAQPVGSTSLIRGLPSTKSLSEPAKINYSVPLFAGRYLFLAELAGRDIRIKEETPGYDERTGLVTVEEARTNVDFVDYTTRELTVLIQDSGEHPVSGKTITISGDNGQAEGTSDEEEGEFTVTLNPGTYTVGVKGAKPEEKEVDLAAGDETLIMTIPVEIELAFDARPRLFDAPEDFLNQFGIDDNPEGYMYYYPPALRSHTYTITATANGHPVEDFSLFVTDDVSMLTADAAEEKEMFVQGEEGHYTVVAGLPKYTLNDTLAAPKEISFRAEKEGYRNSDPAVEDSVIVLGDVPGDGAARIVSIPTVNYTVLHDPPGDGSYSYLDDSITISGIEIGMQIKIKDDLIEEEIPVYPSPWSNEREIEGVSFESVDEDEQEEDVEYVKEEHDLKDRGLLGYEDPDHVGAHFTWVASVEAVTGAAIVAVGPMGYGLQLAQLVVKTGVFGRAEVGSGLIQLEVSPNRRLETPSGDEHPDLLGPGKGDIYFGEGWTLGLQTKHRLGIEKNSDGEWERKTETIETYDILDRNNQYVYTTRDIENIIRNLDAATEEARKEAKKDTTKLKEASETWNNLLDENLAYVWNRDYVSEGLDFEDFTEDDGRDLDGAEGEKLIFSAGPVFEYSRAISRSKTASFSTEVSVESSSEFNHELKVHTGFTSFGSGTQVEWKAGSSASIGSSTSIGEEWESGTSTEQSVGFVLHDDDIGDNIATRVYADPRWGTPIFFQDPGSYTSDPWEAGTNRAIDVRLELEGGPSGGQAFDYREGAHYKLKLTYTGERDLESDFDTADFLLYAPQTDNPDHLTVRFNGNAGPYPVGLTKEGPTALIELSLYPPEKDWGSSEEKEYPVVIQAQEEADAQVSRLLSLNSTFADLRAPRAVVVAPYERQRVSPVFFPEDDPFDIEVVSEDTVLAKIQLQIRSKQPDGVWEPWRNLSGMVWEEDGENSNVTLFDRLDRRPVRREFTFEWTDEEIRSLGVGEYALHAVATDRAGNVDLDSPSVVFLVDDAKPSVLNSIPDYQARESERTYRGELSVTFTDDMRADDFSDRTFAVTDLLEDGKKVAGYVSYSPALRKTIFVPVTPFRPNGFYRVEVKTDVEKSDGTVSRGVHDLAGNPLDNAFSWTFRTRDAPFEETWLVALSATDGIGLDGNNLASVEYGATDGEDEKDARAVPGLLNQQMRLIFVDQPDLLAFERDTRPADGRLSHHWFFVIEDAAEDSTVTIRWRPSIRLTKSTRQYQVIQLTEFDDSSKVANVISLDPGEAETDPETGEVEEVEAYTYKNTAMRISGGDTLNFDINARYFRLDVQKSTFVAETLKAGDSGWQFFSVPIEPERAEPFVNLGDDIDPFQLFQYETEIGGFKIYPFDLGEVGLQTGHGYFTRSTEDVDVDVGGSLNKEDVTVPLDASGWHAIGNPFVESVEIDSLEFSTGNSSATFAQASENEWIEETLHWWKIDSSHQDSYQPVTSDSLLEPWKGYWLKTNRDSLALTIPAPDSLPDYPPSPGYLMPPATKPVAWNAGPRIYGSDAPGRFDLKLTLYSAFASDLTTTLGTHPDARPGWDRLDQSEPPALSRTVSAYFDHPGWKNRSGRYNHDYQPALQMGEERAWSFVVYTDRQDAALTLSWQESIPHIPEDIALHFRRTDPISTDWQDMREVRSVRLHPDSRITRIAFQVRARWPAVEQTALMPCFPNPSNPEVWIPYELAAEGPVEIHIFNLLGQQVRRLDLGVRPRGRYVSPARAAHWDGRNALGAPVSSGVYFCVLRADGFVAMRKLTILK